MVPTFNLVLLTYLLELEHLEAHPAAGPGSGVRVGVPEFGPGGT